MDDLHEDERVTVSPERISIFTTLSLPLWTQHRNQHIELCSDCRNGKEPCNLVVAMDHATSLVQEVRELRRQNELFREALNTWIAEHREECPICKKAKASLARHEEGA